ncbi:MAG: hypothetical protein LUD51_01295 [Clostridia bacterium]|nr:hypothetical protein [Clostridia bacterium]
MEEKAEVVTVEDDRMWQEHEIKRVYPLDGMKVLAVFVDGNSRVYDMKLLCDSSPGFQGPGEQGTDLQGESGQWRAGLE